MGRNKTEGDRSIVVCNEEDNRPAAVVGMEKKWWGRNFKIHWCLEVLVGLVNFCVRNDSVLKETVFLSFSQFPKPIFRSMSVPSLDCDGHRCESR